MNELPEIAAFFEKLPAFESLPETALTQAARGTSIAYYRQGENILEIGNDNPYLHIVRSGAVEVVNEEDELIVRLAEGEYFGFQSLMNRAPVRNRCTAIEDTLIYHVDGAAFAQLRRHYADFDTHFVRALTTRLITARSELSGLGAAGASVGRLLTRPPVTIDHDRSIREAASLMGEERVSALMVLEDGRMTGIVTDRDMRSRVVAEGAPTDAPVATVMTHEPISLEADAHAYDAALLMMQANVHHLPITRNDELAGLVARSDFMRVETEHPLYLVNDLGKQNTVEGLVETCARLPALLGRLIASEATGEQLGRFITAITDAATRQLLRIGERELGPPPSPYAWVALGSQARHEQSAKSDQDNAMIIGGDPDDIDDAYFEALARVVNDGLDACGYVYCPGDVMASNPKWRQPLDQWKKYFHTWITVPEQKALMHANIFFDLRRVYGEAGMVEELKSFIREAAKSNQIFLAMMAKNSLTFQPPLGFFRQFVLDRSGDHRNTLDLKLNGIMPIVEIARIRSLSCGQLRANTRRRLRACAHEGVLTEADAASLIDALDLVEKLRLEHQSRQLSAGQKPDNRLSPDTLSPFVRHNLKTAFQQIRTSQAALLNRFGLA